MSVNGDICFKNNSPRIPKLDVAVASNAGHAASCAAVSEYVTTHVKSHAVGNEAPTSYVYSVVTKDADTDAIYEN